MSSRSAQPGIALARSPLPELGPAGPVDLAAPPAPVAETKAWSAILLPLLSALGMLGFGVLSRNVLALALGGSFAAIGAVGAVASSRSQRRRREREWAARSQAYRAHLAKRVAVLADAASRQRAHAAAVHPAPAGAEMAAAAGLVWERDGRLEVRLGIGRVAARRFPQRLGGDASAGAAGELDAAAEDVLSRFGAVDGMPVGLDLVQTRKAVLLGDLRPLLRALVIGLTRAVTPEAVRVHAMAPPGELSWIRLLPHTGCAGYEAAAFVDALRSASGDADTSHDLILLAGAESEVRAAWQVLAAPPDAPVTVIACLPADSAVPTDADAVMSLDSEGGLLVQRLGDSPVVATIARPDALSHAAASRYSVALSRCHMPRRAAAAQHASPELFSLMAQGKWHPLQLPIGVADDGSVVALDLREAARGGDGPHGLILGATGSGKSELLRTLLTAAACQNDPGQLTFLLVDFKGGAALSELGRLPHTAGVVTNLTADLHAVERLCASMRAELRRRQAVLRLANVDDIDALGPSATGSPDTALPRLLVVVDEYAELIEQSPDVPDVLTSVARLGRSLGIHLLLCSQRLDDGRLRGLEAHLRYRVCLRTFTASESISALGSDLASRLPAAPGWGYLSRDGRLTRMRVALSARQSGLLEPSLPPGASPARPICPPPLPEAVTLDQLPEVACPGTVIAIGLCDRPELARQDPLTYDLVTGGHVAVVGAPKSGRSTLLTTFVAALAQALPARELAIHVICPAGGLLAAVGGLPHVGTVATTPELAARVVTTIAELVAARRTGSAPAGSRILLVVDDLAALQSGDDEVLAALQSIAATGHSVGVTLAVSCGRWAELRGGLREAVGSRYELACGEAADSMLPQLARALPRRPAGRVLTGDGHWAQIALPRGDGRAVSQELAGALAELIAGVARRGGPATQPIQLLPAIVPAASLGPPSDDERVVLGVCGPYAQPIEVQLRAGDHLLVLGNSGTGRSGLLRALTGGLQQQGVRTWVIDPRRSLQAVADRAFRRACSVGEAAAVVQELATSCLMRGGGGEAARRDVLVVDDQELVAGRGGSAVLLPLLDVLPVAADIGLSLVVARRLSGYARGAYEPFFAGFLELCDTAVVLSGDPAEGAVIGGVRPRRLPAGRGQLVARGERAGELQVAWLAPGPADRAPVSAPKPAFAPFHA